MTYVRPSTKLSELIAHAQRDKAISLLEVPAMLEVAQPPALLCIALGYEDIQLLLDTVRPVTDIYGFNNGQASLRGMCFNISAKLPGFVPMQSNVFEILEDVHKRDGIFTLVFEPWLPQRIPAALVIAASGQRYCDLLRERIIPALKREEKLKEDKPLRTHADLPDDVTKTIYDSKKGKG